MKLWPLIITLLMSPGLFAAQIDHYSGLKVELVSTFDGIPWGITLLDDKNAIVTVKKGQAYKVDLVTGEKQALAGLPEVDNRGQGGLLDTAKSPSYAEDSLLYFTYSKPTPQGATTTLARAKLSGVQLLNWQDLLVANAATGTSKHFGGRIAFDDHQHVFFSIGDRGNRANAQNLKNHAGCIIRLSLDGRVPSDNPFVGNPNAKDEIWSYGHRNPQGLFYDLKTHTLWSNEHGPRGGDEINLIRPGGNYGWPIVSYGNEYWGPVGVGEGTEKDGIEKPIKVFTPSIAPGSLLQYHGDLFSDWDGNFLSTALALKHLNKVAIENNGKVFETRFLEDLNERLRSIAEDSQGFLYIGTDSGKLLRISPSTSLGSLDY